MHQFFVAVVDDVDVVVAVVVVVVAAVAVEQITYF